MDEWGFHQKQKEGSFMTKDTEGGLYVTCLGNWDGGDMREWVRDQTGCFYNRKYKVGHCVIKTLPCQFSPDCLRSR